MDKNIQNIVDKNIQNIVDKNIRVAVLGYGNIGRAAEQAVLASPIGWHLLIAFSNIFH